MFKLAVITDEISQDLGVAVKLAKEYSLNAVEIRSVWEKGPEELDEEDISRIKIILGEANLAVAGIASPFFKCDFGDELQYEQHLVILRRCIEFAHKLGTNLIRGFAFWRKAGVVPDWGKISDMFDEPVRIVEGEGIILGLENEASTFITNGKKLAEFLGSIDSGNVKAVWDPGNDISDPEGEIPYPDGYNWVKDWVVHVHIKDMQRDEKTGKVEPTVIGEGQVDYLGQLRRLKEDNYGGYISLETHYRPKVELPEEIVQAPKGAQFSYLGEEGSRACLEGLFRVLRQV